LPFFWGLFFLGPPTRGKGWGEAPASWQRLESLPALPQTWELMFFCLGSPPIDTDSFFPVFFVCHSGPIRWLDAQSVPPMPSHNVLFVKFHACTSTQMRLSSRLLEDALAGRAWRALGKLPADARAQARSERGRIGSTRKRPVDIRSRCPQAEESRPTSSRSRERTKVRSQNRRGESA